MHFNAGIEQRSDVGFLGLLHSLEKWLSFVLGQLYFPVSRAGSILIVHLFFYRYAPLITAFNSRS